MVVLKIHITVALSKMRKRLKGVLQNNYFSSHPLLLKRIPKKGCSNEKVIWRYPSNLQKYGFKKLAVQLTFW